MSAPDPYKTLQVDPEAEDEVIVAAYRRLAMKYHPDRGGGAESAARMAALNAAWERIGEPAARAAYDRERNVAAAMARARPTARRGRDRVEAGGERRADRCDRPAASGDRVARLDERPIDGRRWLRPVDAQRRWHGAAGPPPGSPSGSVLNFGRYAGWSLGEIARSDLGYLEWLDRMPIGRSYRDEIDGLLRGSGVRRSAEAESADRRGLFRRR